MRTALAALAALALALVACGPSISPAMKSATDQLVSGASTAPRNEGQPPNLEPMRWAVGQWTLTRAVNEKGEPTITRTSVVGREDGGWWIETENQDYYRHGITKVLYATQPTTPEEALDAVRKIVTREDGKAEQVMDFTKDDPAMAIAKRFAGRFMKTGVVVTIPPESAREDAKVPAGAFRRCAKIGAKIEAGPFSFQATSWFHPAVPLSGSVKGVSSDGKWTMELLDYGTSGATSRM
jgi:hypothetical protein